MNTLHSSRRLRTKLQVCWLTLGIGALAFVSTKAQAQDTFTGGSGTTSISGADAGAYDYNDAGNWSSGLPGVNAGGHALINNGATVDYFGNGHGGDLFVGGGGILEIANGTFHQVVNNNWIQYSGNGTILVDGGTFNQGTDSNSPFNSSGTGNLFSITSGAAIFNNGALIRSGFTFSESGGTTTVTGGGGLAVNSGATYTQSGGSFSAVGTGNIQGGFTLSGGTLTLTSEFDFNTNVTVSGGTLNTSLITGQNAGTHPVTLTLSAGVINVSDGTAHFDGFYAGSPTQGVNFTLGSTAQFNFTNTNVPTSDIQTMINNGAFEYNGAVDTTDIHVVTNGDGTHTVSVVGAVPEPSTVLSLVSGVGFLAMLRRRRS